MPLVFSITNTTQRLTKKYCAEANLEAANLKGANFARAYLEAANLKGANFARAYLEGAYLVRADRAGANF